MRITIVPAVILSLMIPACSDFLPTQAWGGQGRDVVELPKGFAPEGMAFGKGSTVFVGSLLTGAVWRGDVRTGSGSVLVPETPGRSSTGIKYDQAGNRIFVGGGFTGQAYVYDASSGTALGTFQLADPSIVEVGGSLVNDVVVTGDGAYFTDSFQPVIYRLPLGANGALPAPEAVQVIPITGDYNFSTTGGFNATGIAATPDGKQLIIANSDEGVLYRVNASSGVATRLLASDELQYADGIVLFDHTLFVVRATPDQVTVVNLSADFSSGIIDRKITSPAISFPTALGVYGRSLYVLNGRFDVAPPGQPAPDVDFQMVRVGR